MKGVKSQGMTCHVPYSSDSGIHREESPEDASGSEHHGGGGGGKKKKEEEEEEGKEKKKRSCLVVSDSLRPHGLEPPMLLHPWGFPGKSTGVGCHCLLLMGESQQLTQRLCCCNPEM